jgi:arylsulfatase A-like enzyme
VIAGKAIKFIRTTPADRPFFLMVTPYAGHDPWTPAPRHRHAFDNAPVDLGPGFNEDVSDKPPYIRQRPPSGEWGMRERTRAAWETLRSVDEMVVRMFDTLAETGRVRNTVFIFMSDHGLSSGQHRWQHKLTPYEESIRIPLYVRYDAGRTLQGARSPSVVANVDITPTILELTGTALPSVEGRSLRPLLIGAADRIRDMVLLEHAGIDGDIVPPYCGVRTSRFTYARYAGGFEELYDLQADPYQLTNVVRSPAFAAIATRLDREVRWRCAPTPPGFAFPAVDRGTRSRRSSGSRPQESCSARPPRPRAADGPPPRTRWSRGRPPTRPSPSGSSRRVSATRCRMRGSRAATRSRTRASDGSSTWSGACLAARP